MSRSPVGRRPHDPGGVDARSWWLTAAVAAAVAVLSAYHRSVWSAIAEVMLAAVALLAVARARRAHVRPAGALVTVTVAGLVIGAAVLSAIAVLTA